MCLTYKQLWCFFIITFAHKLYLSFSNLLVSVHAGILYTNCSHLYIENPPHPCKSASTDAGWSLYLVISLISSCVVCYNIYHNQSEVHVDNNTWVTFDIYPDRKTVPVRLNICTADNWCGQVLPSYSMRPWWCMVDICNSIQCNSGIYTAGWFTEGSRNGEIY